LIRFALFGCGRIGRVHAGLDRCPSQGELAWVYDPIESAALEVADDTARPPLPLSMLLSMTPALAQW